MSYCAETESFFADNMPRYDRVKAVQKTGETTRDMWHKTDWNKVREDPKSIAMPRDDWIHFHDAETHAETVFDEIFKRHSGHGDSSENSAAFVEHIETIQPVATT